MKKFIVTSVAAALMLATASPAIAQVTVAGDNSAAQYVDASQVQVAVGAQFGDANAAASDDSTAEASNDLDVTQNQANAGLGEIDDLNQGVDSVGDALIFF